MPLGRMSGEPPDQWPDCSVESARAAAVALARTGTLRMRPARRGCCTAAAAATGAAFKETAAIILRLTFRMCDGWFLRGANGRQSCKLAVGGAGAALRRRGRLAGMTPPLPQFAQPFQAALVVAHQRL